MSDTYRLVTWTTYGSRLRGDPRRFRTFRAKEYIPPPARFAKNGEEIYNPADYAERYAKAKEQVPYAVRLTLDEQQLTLDALVTELKLLDIPTVIFAVGADHVHLIAQFGIHWIRPTVGRLKAAATRTNPNPGNRKRIWTKNCHMESLNGDDALAGGINYVRAHQDEGALIWDSQAAALGGGPTPQAAALGGVSD